MPQGRPLAPLTLTDEQKDQLDGIARSNTLPYTLVLRTRMILASAEGLTNTAVARRFGVTPQTVGKWRPRFRAAGVEDLHDELRPSRSSTRCHGLQCVFPGRRTSPLRNLLSMMLGTCNMCSRMARVSLHMKVGISRRPGRSAKRRISHAATAADRGLWMVRSR